MEKIPETNKCSPENKNVNESNHSAKDSSVLKLEYEHLLTLLRRLNSSARYLNGLLLILVISVISFHPWVLDIMGKAMSIIPLLLLVLVFVYVINPVVIFVLNQIRRMPFAKLFSYQKSLIVTYLLLLLAVLGVGLVFVPRLYQEMHKFAENMPAVTQQAQLKIAQYRHSHFDALPHAVQERITESVGQIGQMAGQLLKGGLQYAGAFSSAVAWMAGAVVMVPIISFYMLADGENIFDYIVQLFPKKRQGSTKKILHQMHLAMQSFLKGQAILCLIIGTITTLAMAVVMPDYCIALGLVAGITEAIPVVGPILGAIPAVVVAFVLPEKGGMMLAIIVIAIYVIIQQVENTVLVPRVMGQSLGLHPLSLMLGMLVFGNMFGFWGVVLAAPIVASVKIIVLHICHKPDPQDPQDTPASGE